IAVTHCKRTGVVSGYVGLNGAAQHPNGADAPTIPAMPSPRARLICNVGPTTRRLRHVGTRKQTRSRALQKRYHVHVSLKVGLRMNKMLSVESRIAAIAVVCLVGSSGVASPWLPLPAVDNHEG